MNELAQAETAKSIATASGEAEIQRAVAEVQVLVTAAKRFPRDEINARDRILRACSRPGLAEKSTYAYTRGGSQITGGSIDYAEALAQNWGNINFGMKELTQRDGVSEVEAFAWDLETMTRRSITFQVPHVRYTTKDGIKKLTDPRDIYELVANQAARRVRKCIEDIIPKDIWEEGLAQCEVTLRNSAGAPEEQIKKLVEAFAGYKVTPDMLMRKLGHKLDAVNQAEVLRLKQTYKGIKDGLTTVEQEFGAAESPSEDAAAPKNAKEAARAKAAKLQEPKPDPKAKTLVTYADYAGAINNAKNEAEAVDLLTSAELVVPPSQHSELAMLVNHLFGQPAV